MEQSAGHVCPQQELPVADEVWLRPYETCSTKQNPTTVISALVKQNHSLKKSGQVTRYQVEFQLIKIYTEIGTIIKIIHVIAPEITHFSFNTNLLSKNIFNPRI